MKQSKHNIIYVLVNVLSILIVAFLPLHIFAVSYRTSKAGFNYQIISGYNVRIGYHTENGSSISYTNAPTAITEKTKMNLVIPELIDDYYTPIEIDSYSFNESSLRSVVLPNTITKIGDTAFSNSLNLAIINIPGSVTNLGNAFSGCKNLRHIISGIENPTSCWSAFNNIATDAHLYVPVGTLSKYKSTGGWMKISNIAEIPGDIFFHDDPAGIVEYLIDSEKNNEVQLGVGSFNAIPLDINSYTIPTSVERDKSVFYVNTIGANAFKDCSNLEVIRMHKNIVHVNNAFSGCSSLGSVYVEWRNPSDIEFESNCFDGIPENVSLYVPAGTKDKYEALAVFNRFSQIVENSPLSIGDVASVIGSQTNLPIILNSEEVISGIQCKLTLPEGVSLVEEEGEPVVSLTNRTEGFTVMGHKDPDAENSYLFVMFSLEGTPITGNKGAIMNVKLNVPSDVELGKYDMIIEDITLATSTFNTLYPATVNSELLIESNVRNIDFADANVKAICVSNWDVNHDGELDADEAASVTNLNNAFKGNTNITSFDELQYFTGLTSIPSYAFNGCNKLLAITIPNSVTSIGYKAFDGCSGLISITIPYNVITIGEYAFDGCSNLTSISIPNSVTSIDASAFNRCSGLTSITVESDNPKYDSRDNCNAIIETSSNTLFFGCKSTLIPTSVTSIGDCAFFECSGLTSITIPTSVTSIGEAAFKYCYNITSISIPNNVTTIKDYAFDGCNGLSFVTVNMNQPISISDNVFSNSSNAILYVPYGSKSAYSSADNWIEFKDIREFSENGFIISANEIFKGTNLWAGYVSQEDLALPDELEAYIITDLGTTTATAYPIDYIPESEPVLLKRENTTIGSFEMLPGTGTAPTMNLLKTYTTDKIVSNREGFVLYNDEFVLVNEGTLPAGCVFLPANSTVVALTRSIIINGDDATEIENTKVDNDVPKDQWYDFQGRKLERKPVKSGIYILNGRKVVVKY